MTEFLKMIGIANDHAGYELKLKIVDYLNGKGYAVKNFGADKSDRKSVV